MSLSTGLLLVINVDLARLLEIALHSNLLASLKEFYIGVPYIKKSTELPAVTLICSTVVKLKFTLAVLFYS